MVCPRRSPCPECQSFIRYFIATKKIQNIASILRLSEVVVLAARRMYTLAVEHKFTKGRKSLNVVAVCLYVACRQKETRNYMLIDFSDLLQVSFASVIASAHLHFAIYR
jgi:transcription initiation factor TFIIIB Brf1 subunit/transcription initiation factor TFIIB